MHKLFILVLIFGCFMASLPSNANPADSKTRFAIYNADLNTRKINPGQSELMQAKLSDAPLLTEKDMVFYEWTNHSFKITPQAKKRLQIFFKEHMSSWGIPFVVVVDGKKCYGAYFWSQFSSGDRFEPIILVDELRGVTPEQNKKQWCEAELAKLGWKKK